MNTGHNSTNPYASSAQMGHADNIQGLTHASQPGQQPFIDPNTLLTLQFITALQHPQQSPITAPNRVQQPSVSHTPPLDQNVLPSFAAKPEFDRHIIEVLHQNENLNQSRSCKLAIETLHGAAGLPAYYWKDYYLEHKYRLDRVVEKRASSAGLHDDRASSIDLVRRDSRASSVTLSARNATQHQPPPLQTKNVPMPYPAPTRKTLPSFKKRTPLDQPKKGSIAPTLRRSLQEANPHRSKNADTIPTISKSRRQTINSIVSEPLRTFPASVSVDEFTGFPVVPSRLPTPPHCPASRRHSSGARKNPFTEEEKAFFWKYIVYECHRDPEMEKSHLFQSLAEKVPTHSVNSWQSFWKNNENMADAIYYYYELEDDDERVEFINRRKAANGPTSPETGSRRAKQKAKYTDLSDGEIEAHAASENGHVNDSDEDAEGSTAESAASDGGEDAEGDYDDDRSSTSSEPAPDLGAKGDSFSEYEFHVLAKYIAKLVGTANATYEDWGTKENWDVFYDDVVGGSERSQKAWREHYRRNMSRIHKIAKRILKKGPISLNTQRRRPSWAPDQKPRFSDLVQGSGKRRTREPSEVDDSGKRQRVGW